MRIRPVTRGSGARAGDAVYCAAYRGGRDLWSERTGSLYKYRWREDVRDTGIVLPGTLQNDPGMDWARRPYSLWNTAEFSENQSNARVAREYMMVLPEQMGWERRRELVYRFAQALADRHGNAIDVALHDRRAGRARHPHAHLLATTRKVGRLGLLEKTDAELSGHRRSSRGLMHTYREEYDRIRALWEGMLRSAVHAAGLPDRVYHSLYREYGRGETSSDYRRRLVREGFDLRRQQSEDARKSQLTPAERQQSAEKQWANRKFRQLERDARAARQLQMQHMRRAGRSTEYDGRRYRTWLPRWDVYKGLLKPWEVEPQVRRVGQTPAMAPWVAKVNPGPEPRIVLRPEPAPRVHRERISQHTPAPMEFIAPVAGVQVWLTSRRKVHVHQEGQGEAVQRWLAQRRGSMQREPDATLLESVSRWIELRRSSERGTGTQRQAALRPNSRQLGL